MTDTSYINTFREKVKKVKVRTKRFVETVKERIKEVNVEVVDMFKEIVRLEESNLILETRNKVLEQALIRATEARKVEEKGNVGKKRKKVDAEVEEKLDVDRRKGKKEKVNVDQDQLTVKGEKKRKKGATFNEVSRGRRKILEEIEGKDKARIRECFLWVKYWYDYCKVLVVFIPLWYSLVKEETHYLYDKNTTAVIISNKLAGPCLR